MSTIKLTIEIPIEDLQIVRAALNSAYHQNTVLDLADQYRKLYQRPTQSKLTKGLEAALGIVLSYIEAAEEPDEDPEEVPGD